MDICKILNIGLHYISRTMYHACVSKYFHLFQIIVIVAPKKLQK